MANDSILTRAEVEQWRHSNLSQDADAALNTITQAVELLEERCYCLYTNDGMHEYECDRCRRVAEWLARYHAGEKEIRK